MPERPQLKPNELCVTIVCDGLHPDDVEELQRTLAGSRYEFEVDVAQKVKTENYPELSFIGIRTKLIVRFSEKWFYRRTRQGGVKAVVGAIDEVLDRSTHDRDRRPKVSFDSNGQELITTETWLRPRTKKHSWTRDHKLALGILMLTGVAALAAILVVPEFRRFFHLDKPETTRQVQAEKQSSTPSVTTPAAPIQSTELSKPAEVPKPKNSKPKQKTDTHVKGNDKVAGNNISGHNNVTGNNNRTAPVAVAPNGIAITGGTVNNPTVNNFVPPLPTPTVTICVTHSSADNNSAKNILTFKTDVEIMESWYALFFDGPVGEGSVEMTPHSFDYTHSRADKLEHPENTFLFRNSSIDFGPPRWLPNNTIKVTVPSEKPVNLVKLMSGSGENGRDEKFVFSCD